MADSRLLTGYVYTLLVVGSLAFLYGGYLSVVLGGNGVEIGLLGACLLFLSVPCHVFAVRNLERRLQLQVIGAATVVVALIVVVYLVADGSAPQFGLAIALAVLAIQAARR